MRKNFLINVRVGGNIIACWDAADPVEAFDVACEGCSEDDFSEVIYSRLRERIEGCKSMNLGERQVIEEEDGVSVSVKCEEGVDEEEEA
ncbi:MAG: hypothetical protein RIR91_343 [Verrucomicrobiota bacterium]